MPLAATPRAGTSKAAELSSTRVRTETESPTPPPKRTTRLPPRKPPPKPPPRLTSPPPSPRTIGKSGSPKRWHAIRSRLPRRQRRETREKWTCGRSCWTYRTWTSARWTPRWRDGACPCQKRPPREPQSYGSRVSTPALGDCPWRACARCCPPRRGDPSRHYTRTAWVSTSGHRRRRRWIRCGSITSPRRRRSWRWSVSGTRRRVRTTAGTWEAGTRLGTGSITTRATGRMRSCRLGERRLGRRCKRVGRRCASSSMCTKDHQKKKIPSYGR
mmetsp:Transcript_11778/g.54810  ORF Transcript_11778/g.54810 Transcript_11778/m.54810 type:complete len:272 (-) Transcript_11778:132-947(-)